MGPLFQSGRQQTHSAFRSLRRSGEVRYAAGDVTDLSMVESAVEQCADRWGASLNGIVHLAGTYREALLADESPDSLWSVLQPKVLGTLALHRLAERQPGDPFVIHFSSVAAHLGGAMVGAYAAANRF